MFKDQNIICFAPSDWWAMNPSCTTHIMQKLAQKNKILYINPFSSDLLGASKSGLAKRIIRKLKSMSKVFRKSQHNLYVLSPIFLPLQGTRFFDAINNLILKWQIKIACLLLNISRPILWLENLRAADTLEWFNPLITVYHASDLFEECSYTTNNEVLRKRQQQIIDNSDVVICVSQKLYQLRVSQKDNVFYLPHGVDFELFYDSAHGSGHIIDELSKVPRPVVGYFGTLTTSNDIEMLQYCAEHLPNVSFVFVGDITGGDYSVLAGLPNVHFFGKMSYERIPHLCANFDVCLLPWKVDKWIEFCNPLKFFEYMASGRPIVSVRIAEVANKYSNVVSVAETKEQFCQAIQWELTNDTLERALQRIEVAREHNWDNHIERLSEIMNNAISAKCSAKKPVSIDEPSRIINE